MYKWTFKTIPKPNSGANIVDTGATLVYCSPMTRRTLEQQINEANDRLARLKARQKKAEARQHIVLGAALLSVGRMSADNANALLALLDQANLRDAEQRDIAPIIEELKQIASAPNPGGPDQNNASGN